MSHLNGENVLWATGYAEERVNISMRITAVVTKFFIAYPRAVIEAIILL
jgi:hypothetical protein